DPLVVLRRDERQCIGAVDQREKADLLADEALLDDNLDAGRTEPALAERRIYRGIGLGQGGGDGDGFGRGGLAEAAVGGGRDALTLTQILHEAFGTFERSRGLARPEGGDPRRFE